MPYETKDLYKVQCLIRKVQRMIGVDVCPEEMNDDLKEPDVDLIIIDTPSLPIIEHIRRWFIFALCLLMFFFYFWLSQSYKKRKEDYERKKELHKDVSAYAKKINSAAGYGKLNKKFSVVQTELYLYLLKNKLEECRNSIADIEYLDKIYNDVDSSESFHENNHQLRNYDYSTYYEFLYTSCRLYFDEDDGLSSSLDTMRSSYVEKLKKLRSYTDGTNRGEIRKNAELVRQYLLYELDVLENIEKEENLKATFEEYEKAHDNLTKLIEKMKESLANAEDRIKDLTIYFLSNVLRRDSGHYGNGMIEGSRQRYIQNDDTAPSEGELVSSSSSNAIIEGSRQRYIQNDDTAPSEGELVSSSSSNAIINTNLSFSNNHLLYNSEIIKKVLEEIQKADSDQSRYVERAESLYLEDYKIYKKKIENIVDRWGKLQNAFDNNNQMNLKSRIYWDNFFIVYILWVIPLVLNLFLITLIKNKTHLSVEAFSTYFKKAITGFLYASCTNDVGKSNDTQISQEIFWWFSEQVYDYTSFALSWIKESLGFNFIICAVINTLWGIILFVILIIFSWGVGKLTNTNPLSVIGLLFLPLVICGCLKPTLNLLTKYILASKLYLLFISLTFMSHYYLTQCLLEGKQKDCVKDAFIAFPRTKLYPILLMVAVILAIHCSFCFTHVTHSEAIETLWYNINLSLNAEL